MVDIKLLPHNEDALEKLNKCLETNQMASINHATGTGKSFILLKYLYQNKDKRILYLAPTYPIINQLVENHMEELNISKEDFSNFDTMIYRHLLSITMSEIADSYDIIILDEYHRCGAPKWGKKVIELLEIIREKYPEKKVIGTTATEIRYLDNKKDMNQILFNGVEASRLSLADAILGEILPPPIYVNYNYTLLSEIGELEDNIRKYAFYSKNLESDLRSIVKVRSELEKILFRSDDVLNYLNNCKKTLVFSNTIDSIKSDRKIIERYLGIDNKTFVVHSLRSHEKNKEELNNFSKQDDSTKAILYSINILNEGVHVKGVDSIFMLRKTTSPIIYFQQLGRLLSYSKRKENVVVIDLVNNICNNPVIYELYEEVVERAKELSKIHPENKEKYEEIINRFTILDKTGKLCKIIDDLREIYKKDAIIDRRLNTAVSILEGEIESTEVDKYMAQLDLLKYEEYITPDLLNRIRKLDIKKKPSLVKIPQDEFVLALNGNKNIHEKKKEKVKAVNNNIMEFYEENDRLPSIFSTDEDEVNIAKSIIENYGKLFGTTKRFIKDNITDDLSIFERVVYNEQILDLDFPRLGFEVDMALSKGIKIPLIVYQALFPTDEPSPLKTKVYENLQDDEGDALIEAEKKNCEEYVTFTRNFEKVASKVNEDLKTIPYEQYIIRTYQDIINYMKKFNKDISYDKSSKNSKTETRSVNDIIHERELYCKKVLLNSGLEEYGFLDKINNLSVEIKTNNILAEKTNIIKRLISFVKEHEGALPSAKNPNTEEISLAKLYMTRRSSLGDELLKQLSDVQGEFSEEKGKVLHEVIEFIKVKGRRPMISNAPDEEIELCKKFNRWSSSFTEEEREEINKALKPISNYEELKRTYEAVKEYKKKK